ncbi:hypothetical protein EVG20_g10965 [Dentipellis fragilis]|uniref:Uncharacterized protein n=1 Tax=Dentipellis fragilis TaxID=205917 RepID=A0A4Y9XQ76_9AGAM|nr:hypothetical protein EVG20_g10965 [Dentipellis fragilis]
MGKLNASALTSNAHRPSSFFPPPTSHSPPFARFPPLSSPHLSPSRTADKLRYVACYVRLRSRAPAPLPCLHHFRPCSPATPLMLAPRALHSCPPADALPSTPLHAQHQYHPARAAPTLSLMRFAPTRSSMPAFSCQHPGCTAVLTDSHPDCAPSRSRSHAGVLPRELYAGALLPSVV